MYQNDSCVLTVRTFGRTNEKLIFIFAADVDVEEHQEISSQREPLPDLLPQNERVSRGSPPDRAPRNQVAQDLEVRRVARQLRVIGDQFNATVLRRQVRSLLVPFMDDQLFAQQN